MQIDQARFTGIVTTATAATGAILQGVTAVPRNRPAGDEVRATDNQLADAGTVRLREGVYVTGGGINPVTGAAQQGQIVDLRGTMQQDAGPATRGAAIGQAFAGQVDTLAAGVTDIVMAGILDATGHKIFGRCELPDGTRINEVDGGTPIPLNW